ncbi:Hypothetical predicted protein, partial [Drosophila guanche]
LVVLPPGHHGQYLAVSLAACLHYDRVGACAVRYPRLLGHHPPPAVMVFMAVSLAGGFVCRLLLVCLDLGLFRSLLVCAFETCWAHTRGSLLPNRAIRHNRTKIKAFWVCYWINVIALSMPSIFFNIDHLIVAQTTRLLHFVYPLEFGWIYTGFTLVYYVMGGLDL